jgi:nitrate/nitrite-specific signal transduction histidine kinase
VWVRVAAMHFEGSVAWWLQSVDHRIRTATWTELCSWIHEQFGRDEHDSLIRQLFHIKQTSSVQEDIDRFTELIDQLVVYGQSKSDHRYYTAQLLMALKMTLKLLCLYNDLPI